MTPIDDSWTDAEKAAYHRGQADALEKPKLTLADIRAMDAKEIMARKREVDDVLRNPVATQGDDDE